MYRFAVDGAILEPPMGYPKGDGTLLDARHPAVGDGDTVTETGALLELSLYDLIGESVEIKTRYSFKCRAPMDDLRNRLELIGACDIPDNTACLEERGAAHRMHTATIHSHLYRLCQQLCHTPLTEP